MIAGFTLFGFDLFGLSRREPTDKERVQVTERVSEPKKVDDKTDAETRPDPSESFFWGMYPVY